MYLTSVKNWYVPVLVPEKIVLKALSRDKVILVKANFIRKYELQTSSHLTA